MIPLARSSPGNIPSEVARWQWFLREKAGQSGLVIDGVFGGKTEAATRAFQQVYRLPPTGQADEGTLSHAAKLGYTLRASIANMAAEAARLELAFASMEDPGVRLFHVRTAAASTAGTAPRHDHCS